MSVSAPNRNYSTEPVLIAVFSMAALSVHLLTSGHYGYFRDELYYFACGRHLAFGYYGRGAGVGRTREVGVALGVAVAVGVGVGVDEPDWAQYLPPVLR
jgi:hypothetical protein